MPVRTDIRKIIVIGSGPIQIGQGCEFDYSGTQACHALRELGFIVSLVNSNPATIMTDETTADRVYIEPLTCDSLVAILESDRPDAILPTVGGQVALNLFLQLEEKGHLQRLGVHALGVSSRTVILTEDRTAFRQLLVDLGLEIIRGDVASSREAAEAVASQFDFPLVVRTSFTLGGAGGGIVESPDQFKNLIERVYTQNPSAQVVIEESMVGWKEYELEVMRDSAGTFVVVCGVENINPMGVHTGDSVTCAPCMTLTDVEFQNLRDIAKQIFEKVGMETGGANIQFAVHPDSGRVVVVEMNPRVSRSSALVSKATGYPIARLAAKLSVGLTLADLKNELTQTSSAAFEPAIDYVAVKIPRFDFAKYQGASRTLGVQMKSVGEVLSFGRTFRDAFNKAWRSLELGYEGWPSLEDAMNERPLDGRLSFISKEDIQRHLSSPTPLLFPAIKSALQRGFSLDEIHSRTRVSLWFLSQLKKIVEIETELSVPLLADDALVCAKQDGLTNATIAKLTGLSLDVVEQRAAALGLKPTFKMVDSCAGEFEARTPYFYKTFEFHDENLPSTRPKVVILGSGPNRIGQGVEFDYSCVHAVRAAQDAGFEVILINCNPETVSTDYVVSDKLFIEPLHREDVLDILRAEKPDGVFVQFGGQSPLKLAKDLLAAGFNILGTPFDVIELAENRHAFGEFISRNGFKVPVWSTGIDYGECLTKAETIGYPLLVRPSYVLGGRAMKIVRSSSELNVALSDALDAAQGHPLLLDKYLDGAIEFDVDLVCDGQTVYIPAVMEHIEEAGIHSGDSISIIPCLKASGDVQQEIRHLCEKIALQLGVRGLLNIQLALHNKEIFILEVNPRSSRSVPFVSKAVGVPLAWLGARVALGAVLSELLAERGIRNESLCVKNSGIGNSQSTEMFAVKAPVFPFHKFPGVNPHLGPEMRSIGEVMGTADTAGGALAKALTAAGWNLQPSGDILLFSHDSEMKEQEKMLFEQATRWGCRTLVVGPSLQSSEQKTTQFGSGHVVLNQPEQARALAADSLRSGRLSLVVSLGQSRQDVWRSLVSEVATWTTHGAVPLIESNSALDAWVMAINSTLMGRL